MISLNVVPLGNGLPSKLEWKRIWIWKDQFQVRLIDLICCFNSDPGRPLIIFWIWLVKCGRHFMRQPLFDFFKQIHRSKHRSSFETIFVLTRDYKQEIQPRIYCVYIKSIWTQSMGLLIIPSDLPTHKVTKFCIKQWPKIASGLLYKCIYASNM